MKTIHDSIDKRLIESITRACEYLDRGSRRSILWFLETRWGKDGGVCGRDERSDLYYTLFSVLILRSLRGVFPTVQLWRYLRSFCVGESLDLVHFCSFMRLRSAFPMRRKTRARLKEILDAHPVETAYDGFVKALAGGEVAGPFPISGPTPQIAAALVLNGRRDPEGARLLMERFCPEGGFCAGPQIAVPDLLSTAVALFALRSIGEEVGEICEPCLDYVESLWRDSGGFAGHADDSIEDVEYTFYGLLSIGCLME